MKSQVDLVLRSLEFFCDFEHFDLVRLQVFDGDHDLDFSVEIDGVFEFLGVSDVKVGLAAR